VKKAIALEQKVNYTPVFVSPGAFTGHLPNQGNGSAAETAI
jgi:hypothetical protein